MAVGVSIYLDLVRLVAALLVFVYHSYGSQITGGFLWPLAVYDQTAVMVFFVLSGYVIGHVSGTRESSAGLYFCARISRLYSVILPALAVTLLCNELGRFLLRPEYQGPWNRDEPYEYVRYVATLAHVQDIWWLNLSPTNNGSFWSISFEVFYYLLYAVIAFVRKPWARVGLLVAMLGVAGPTIAALWPLWLLGWLVQRVHTSRRFDLRPAWALPLFMVSMGLLMASPLYRQALDMMVPGITRQSILGDLLDGLLFSMHVWAAPAVVQRLQSSPLRLRRALAVLATLSFALYLLHLPLIRFFAEVSPFIESPDSAANRIFVIGLTLVVCGVVGLQSEKLKGWMKQSLAQRFLAAGGPRQGAVALPDTGIR